MFRIASTSTRRSPASGQATRRVSAVLFAAIAALAVAACDDGPSGPETHDDHPVTSLVVAPLQLDLEVGDEVTLSATARCVHDVVIDARITWSSDRVSVAQVATDGKVKAAAYGSTTIRATAGSESATIAVAVAPEGTVVSAVGGLVGSSDGVISIEIPAGALTEPTDIVIEELPDTDFSDDPLFVAGTAYRVRPEALQLQERARIRIRYEEANVPWGATQDRLRIQERDRDRDRWMEMDQNQVHTQTREVEATALHFGTFALVPAHFADIGGDGGEVTSADGLGTLTVHAAALGEEVEISIHRVPDDWLFITGPLYIPGTAFELVPEGVALQERAHFRIRYDPASLPPGVTPEQLRIQYFDAYQLRWRETHQNQVRVEEHEVEGEIGHFSIYALVAANGGTVGAGGGTIASADGLVSLEVPSGALDADTEITIEPVDDPPFADDPFYIAGTAYQLIPEGLEFQAPARLQIRYNAENMPEGLLHERLRVRERDQTANEWRETEQNQVHVTERIAEGQIGHFSVYAVVGLDQAEIPVASVAVDPATLTLEVDNSAQLTAVAQGEDGYPVARTFNWTSSDPGAVFVDADGVLTALESGTVEITAETEGRSGSATVTVPVYVTSVTITPANAVLAIGDTRQLTAIARGADGSQILRTFDWSSSNEAVATVSTTGLLSAIGDGTVVISASTAGVTGNATVTVHPPVARVAIDDIGMEPLEIGLTRQLDATAYDASNVPVDAIITWTSSDEGIATVDETGLVSAVGRGVVTITASVGAAAASVDIRTVGEAGGYGNNLSWPVVFADGIGITGSPVSSDPGVRPAAGEGITVDALPFFWEGNVPNYDEIYYEQQSFNVWQAEWIDGTGEPPFDAQIFWGDNLTHQTWSASRPIRVEQVLSAVDYTLDGYVMSYLYGQGPSEMQGTDGTVASFIPTIYTIGASVKIEKLDGEGGSPVDLVTEAVVGSEVNVGGKIIYGYNLFLSDWTPGPGISKDGWYRITYTLADGSNTTLASVGNAGDEVVYMPEVHASGRYSWIDIYIEP